MSATAPAFNEHENRFLLAEIIKASEVPIETLLNIVREENIDPNWEEVLVPTGRNVKACSNAFYDLLSKASLPSSRRKSAGASLPSSSRKRQHSPAPRNIQPRPPNTGARESDTLGANAATPRKRGRPSNAELAARISSGGTASGQTLLAPKPTDGGLTAAAANAGTFLSSTPVGDAVSRARGRPRKSETPSVSAKELKVADVGRSSASAEPELAPATLMPKFRSEGQHMDEGHEKIKQTIEGEDQEILQASGVTTGHTNTESTKQPTTGTAKAKQQFLTSPEL